MQQKITIVNKRGEKLVGVLHETGSTKLVVLCHGATRTKEDNIIVNLAVVLENQGINAFRFDFSGNGESEGFQSGLFSNEVEDLRAVVEYFNGKNRSTLAVLGHSKGGDDVLFYASKYLDINAVINISGRYDLTRVLESLDRESLEKLKNELYIEFKTETGNVDSLMERLNTNFHESCKTIQDKCKVLIVHGSADEINPVEDAMEFAKIIPNNRLQIIEGAGHFYTSHQDELASAVLNFVNNA